MTGHVFALAKVFGIFVSRAEHIGLNIRNQILQQPAGAQERFNILDRDDTSYQSNRGPAGSSLSANPGKALAIDSIWNDPQFFGCRSILKLKLLVSLVKSNDLACRLVACSRIGDKCVDPEIFQGGHARMD